MENPTDTISGSSKSNPFYVNLNEKWTDLAKSIKDVNEENPIIALKNERLMFLCKTDDDFRTIQRYLDENTKIFTTLRLHPRDQRQ